MSLQSEFAEIAAMDGRAALVTVIAGSELGAKLLVRADGSTDGGLGSPELDSVALVADEAVPETSTVLNAPAVTEPAVAAVVVVTVACSCWAWFAVAWADSTSLVIEVMPSLAA